MRPAVPISALVSAVLISTALKIDMVRKWWKNESTESKSTESKSTKSESSDSMLISSKRESKDSPDLEAQKNGLIDAVRLRGPATNRP